MTKVPEDFKQAYQRYMEDGGHSYDSWDIAWAYGDYCANPKNYSWLQEYL